MDPNLTAAVLLPQQTHGDQRVLLLSCWCTQMGTQYGGRLLIVSARTNKRHHHHHVRTAARVSSRVLASKLRDRPQSNIFDEPFGVRKRGPDRVMGLCWGFVESTHHTARTVGYSSESCTRRSNGFPRQVAAGDVLP
jgi:hypothetical protein